MDSWIEIEDNYLTNQPMIRRGRKTVPDPNVEPTEAWLVCYRCTRTPKKRRVRRKRYLHVLKGENAEDLDQQLMDFTVRNGVMLVKVDDSKKYIQSGAEPDPIAIGA